MKTPLTVSLAMLGLALACGVRPVAAEGGLQPYQMVRSLQLVQDRIADGDHAALPMQRKLLELVDTRLRAATNEDFADRRNFQALMIYAMSGGNPSTVADSLARLDMDERDRAAGAGVLGYLTGDMAQARAAMMTIDPTAQPPELAAFLSLVKGSVIAGDSPSAAILLLDRARLLAPGTLVEEAALRRTVSLAATQRQPAKFMTASEQYARRFLRSPYASQFAEAFVAGIIELKRTLDLPRIEQTIAWMTVEQARTIYLRLARNAAIDGDADILEFASRKAREHRAGTVEQGDPRGDLYSSLSSVTSETVEQTLERLRALDASRLSGSDRALLQAAKAIAAEVVAPVTAAVPPPSGLQPARNPDAAVEEDGNARVQSARSRLDDIDKLLAENER